MKILLTIMAIILLFSGCATRNAFSKFNITKDQEIAIENTKSGKLKFENEIGGVYSAVYLNNVYQELDDKTIKFYISVYIKDKSENLNFILEKKAPVDIKKLPLENEYSHLLPKTSGWSKNFLVSFENNGNYGFNLMIESDQFSSGPLNYLKDLQ